MAAAEGSTPVDLDREVAAHLADGDTARAATVALRALGPEIFGFLLGVVGRSDAEEVFSAFSERLWRSLETFQGRCSVRTWGYVLARHEMGRYRRGARRHERGRVPISELEEVLAAAKTATSSALDSSKRSALVRLRDELPIEDRTLLVLRIDRKLAWDDIALAFAEQPEAFTPEERKRESSRLRKRFQLVKERLVARARSHVARK
jgi:RNA polymerase sigma-70 factor (ECF subfamily)